MQISLLIRVSACLMLTLLASIAQAQTSQGTAFTYQGLLSQNGTPIDGNVDIVFDLFDAATGGNAVGSSLVFTAANGNPIAVQAGVFDATLDFGSLAFNGVTTDQRFLRVTVNGVALAPRTPIQNAPYALQSRTSELAYTVSNGAIGTAQINAAQVQRRVGGSCASGSSISGVNADGTVACQGAGSGTISGVTAGSGLSGGGTSGNVSLSADTSFVQKRVNGVCASGSAVQAIAADGTVTCQSSGSGTITNVTAGNGLSGGGSSGSIALGIADPLHLTSADTGGVILATSTRATAGVGIHGVISSSGGNAVFGESSATAGVGIGVVGRTASSDGAGVVGTNSSTGANAYGVYGGTSSPAGTAIYAEAYASSGTSSGVFGQTDSPNGSGLYGRGGTFSGSLGAGTGVFGESASGYGVLGRGHQAVRGESAAIDGIGAVGYATATTGSTRGVYGESDSPSGHGIDGFSGAGIGVYGASTSNSGVYGTTQSGNGVEGHFTGSGAGSGVYGTSSYYGVQGFSSNAIGVYGKTDTGYAGYFDGNIRVVGSVSKSGGSFQIDHPLDPANKYLYHSFVESPDMKNIYDGVATLDARGEAWVEMPAYFEALNRDFRYQLTALDAPAPSLHVAARIEGNRFKLAGGQAGQQVSWQVTGTRKDAYAEAHRIVPEVDKPANERGKYLHPTLFGKPESMAVSAVAKALELAPTPATLPQPVRP